MKAKFLNLFLSGAVGLSAVALAAPGEVLILSETVTGGLGSPEAQAVVAAGKTPVLVDGATWSTMTAAEFAQYDALVLGDPTCDTCPSCHIQAAVDTAMIWGPIVDGNVIIIGSDPVYHHGWEVGAQKLIRQGIAFSVAEAGKTGAYIDLSCYYHFSSSGTPVPVLDGLNGGGFTVIGAYYLPGLNDVHIVASHPALAGLTDADLSNWGNSVHEGFNTWPVQFEVLAIARDPRGSHTAPDGTVGYPYILARGQELVVLSDITLEPRNATNSVGTAHTVTATVTENGNPVVGTVVQVEILSGPHAGWTGSAATDSNGQVSFTYTGTAVGTDFIQASFVDSQQRTQTSNKATKHWIQPCDPPVATAVVAGGNKGYYRVGGSSECHEAEDLKIWVKDTASAFVAGPYDPGTIIRLIRIKTGSPSEGPGFGPAAVTIRILGVYAQVVAEDPDGQVSAPVSVRAR